MDQIYLNTSNAMKKLNATSEHGKKLPVAPDYQSDQDALNKAKKV